MLNFRESLVKLRLSKLRKYGKKREVDDIIKHLTEYFSLKTIPEFLNKTYIFFGVSSKKFYIREEKKDIQKVFYIDNFDKNEEAEQLLKALEDKLQSEGFETHNECGGFWIELDPSVC